MLGIISNSLKSLFSKITKLSRPYVSLEEDDLKFKLENDNTLKYTLKNIETKTRHDAYVIEAYTLSADGIYMEYINTNADVSWNGQALSFFVSLLKSNIRATKFDLLEKEEFPHYEFLTYRVDNSYILNIIYVYEMHKEVFIIDTKTDLYEKLLKNFKRGYTFSFKKNNDFVPDIVNLSLVKNNAMNSYFRMAGG